MGVDPGDTIKLGLDTDPWDSVGSIDITLQGAAGGATDYLVTIGCGETTTTDPVSVINLEIPTKCVKAGNFVDVIAAAFDSNGNAIGLATANNVAIDPGGTVAVTTSPWSIPTTSMTTIALNNPPAFASQADLKFGLTAGVGEYAVTEKSGDLTSDLALLFSYPAGIADGLSYLLCVYQDPAPAASDDAVSYHFAHVIGTPASITHDLGTELLPRVSLVALSTDIPDRPTVVISADEALTATDGGVAVVTWDDPLNNSYEWVVMFPPTLKNVTLPVLPEFVSNLRPTAQSTYGQPRAAYLEADFIEGYGELRTAYGFSFLLHNIGTPESAAYTIRAAAGPNGFFQ
jgi:hypothetical protein